MNKSNIVSHIKQARPIAANLSLLLLLSMSWLACGAASSTPKTGLSPEVIAQIETTPPEIDIEKNPPEIVPNQKTPAPKEIEIKLASDGKITFSDSAHTFADIDSATEHIQSIAPDPGAAQPKVTLQVSQNTPMRITSAVLDTFSKAGFERVGMQIAQVQPIESSTIGTPPDIKTHTPIVTANAESAALNIQIENNEEMPENGIILAVPDQTLAISAGFDNHETPESNPIATPGKYTIEARKQLAVEFQAGKIQPISADTVRWTAPRASGLQKINLTLIQSLDIDNTTPRVIKGNRQLKLLVQHQFDRTGMGLIDDYPIGLYPNEKGPQASASVQRRTQAFAPPEWFIEVTPEIEKLHLSENFTLADFSPPNLQGKRHFIAVQPYLPVFLEKLLTQSRNRFGEDIQIKILRGYMSPNERQMLAQKGINYTLFTRYQYGDAAAIALVKPGQDKMADLNNDNEINRTDADILADLVRKVRSEMDADGWTGSFDQPIETDWPETPFVVFDLRSEYNRQNE